MVEICLRARIYSNIWTLTLIMPEVEKYNLSQVCLCGKFPILTASEQLERGTLRYGCSSYSHFQLVPCTTNNINIYILFYKFEMSETLFITF